MAKKNNIKVGLIKGNTKISNETKHDVKLLKGISEVGAKAEKMVEPVMLISRLDYPENIIYGDRTIRLSPRSKLPVADASKLGTLPKGVVKKRLEGREVKSKK